MSAELCPCFVGSIRCCRPVTRTVVWGCVHEHIHETASCDLHATGQVSCGLCFRVDGHMCPVRVLSDVPVQVSA